MAFDASPITQKPQILIVLVKEDKTKTLVRLSLATTLTTHKAQTQGT